MQQQQGWMNLYHSGFYHRRGKPLDINVHGGDVYLSYEDALSQAEPDKGYFATVAIAWEAPKQFAKNAADSQPISISESRKLIAARAADWIDA